MGVLVLAVPLALAWWLVERDERRYRRLQRRIAALRFRSHDKRKTG
jgi:hypothetical protein